MSNSSDSKQFTELGSPISPLVIRSILTTTTTSSSCSSNSSGKPIQKEQLLKENSSATSPVSNLLPAGNICPSGKIGNLGMTNKIAARKDVVLGSGTGNYGHGSILRGGGSLGMAKNYVDPEEATKAGNESYKKGNFGDALKFYDRAVEICPGNAACRNDRAAALGGLGRLEEAVKECGEAVRLDPGYCKAHHRLYGLYLR